MEYLSEALLSGCPFHAEDVFVNRTTKWVALVPEGTEIRGYKVKIEGIKDKITTSDELKGGAMEMKWVVGKEETRDWTPLACCRSRLNSTLPFQWTNK